MAVILLGATLPLRSSHLPADLASSLSNILRPPIWCCSGWRLPRFTRFDKERSDSSLWPCSSPWSAALQAATYCAWALPSILLCGARTFLSPRGLHGSGQRRSGWLRAAEFTRIVRRVPAFAGCPLASGIGDAHSKFLRAISASFPAKAATVPSPPHATARSHRRQTGTRLERATARAST